MNIAARGKIDILKPDCASVALYMALEFFGKINHEGDEGQVNEGAIQETYRRVDAMGEHAYYAVPWGICNGAVSYGLKVTFISMDPLTLMPDHYLAIQSSLVGCGDLLEIEEIKRRVQEQRDAAVRDNNIKLLSWKENLLREQRLELLRTLIEKESAVVIPTICYNGGTPHGVVITGIVSGKVFYNDPNDGAISKTTDEFLGSWLVQKVTDNDLLIVSKNPIPAKFFAGLVREEK